MNKSEIEIKVIEVLRRRRAESGEMLRRNLLRARENQEFASNEKELRTIELDIAKAERNEKAALETKKAALLAERAEILKKMNMAESDLEPKFYCPSCHDTGFAGGKQCKCYKTLMLKYLIEESGIETKELVTFNDFDENVATDQKQREQLAKYKKYLMDLAEKFPAQKAKCITVCGFAGTGKTFGAKCLACEILKKQETVLFLTAFELSTIMLKYHTAFVQDKNAIMDTLLEPELLVIDDLGTEPMLKKVTIEYLYVVLSERLNRGKTTFITTNLGLENILERYGERIFSRLQDKKQTATILLAGDDLRHRK